MMKINNDYVRFKLSDYVDTLSSQLRHELCRNYLDIGLMQKMENAPRPR
jgi:hypothetical protein